MSIRFYAQVRSLSMSGLEFHRSGKEIEDRDLKCGLQVILVDDSEMHHHIGDINGRAEWFGEHIKIGDRFDLKFLIPAFKE